MPDTSTPVPPEPGQGMVRRRAVIGATFAGIGAASLVGVTAATTWPDSTSGNGSGEPASGGQGAETISGAQIDFTATPDESWDARDPALRPASPEVERRIPVVAREDVGEIAPGTTPELWNFDGVVPGPVDRGREADRRIGKERVRRG